MGTEYQLNLTAEEIEERLSDTGVTAGTYGSYNSLYYYIPNITVNEQGKITSASTSYLGEATIKQAGFISANAYNHLVNNKIYYANGSVTGDGDYLTLSGFLNVYTYNSSDGIGAIYMPRILGVYLYLYIDSTNRRWTPAEYTFTAGTSSTSVYPEIPDKYKDYNTGDSVRCVVLYDKTLSTSTM